MIDKLDDWLAGRLDAGEADAFEDELFDLAVRGQLPPEARFFDRVWTAGLMLFRGGTFEPGVVRADLRRFADAGRTVAVMDLDGDGPHVVPDTEVVVMRIPLPADPVEAVEIVGLYEGVVISTLRDLPVAPGSNEVLICCEGERARLSAGVKWTMTIYAREGLNRRQLVSKPIEIVASAGDAKR